MDVARPLSEEKRQAILDAAAELVAAMGTGASTARIAKGANVSEGTLFTYFATKDALLNQLYLDIEAELAGAMLADFPAGGSARERACHLWDRFIDWGAANPVKRKALRQLKVSDRITAESRHCSDGLFRDVKEKLGESLAEHASPDQPPDYVGAVLDTLAGTTLEFMADDPAQRDHYKQLGFQLLWKGIAR